MNNFKKKTYFPFDGPSVSDSVINPTLKVNNSCLTTLTDFYFNIKTLLWL